MRLHVQQVGEGPDVVLLHGWGLHSGVFTNLGEQLKSHYRISLIDMPGHGRSAPSKNSFNLAQLTDMVAAAAPPHATWLGWSLGGMVAAQLALSAPDKVQNLILINSSPRFVTGKDWPWAMAPSILEGFAKALEGDYRETLDRFLSLQIASGSTEGRHNLRQLRVLLSQYPAPSAQALYDGLAILRSSDLRAQFSSLHCPTLMILGDRDRLVPPDVGPAAKKLLPTLHLDVIKDAGHVPFLSHQQLFHDKVIAFLEH